MANRETYPASQSPLQGDISGPAGATQVTVVGFQNIPAQAGTPADMAGWVYDANDNIWIPKIPANIAVILNASENGGGLLTGGEILSDDWEFYVNNVGLDVLVGWPYGFANQVFVNGVGVVGT